MPMLAVGRVTQPEAGDVLAETHGHGLVQDEPLIFELGGW